MVGTDAAEVIIRAVLIGWGRSQPTGSKDKTGSSLMTMSQVPAAQCRRLKCSVCRHELGPNQPTRSFSWRMSFSSSSTFLRLQITHKRDFYTRFVESQIHLNAFRQDSLRFLSTSSRTRAMLTLMVKQAFRLLVKMDRFPLVVAGQHYRNVSKVRGSAKSRVLYIFGLMR